MVKIEAPTLEDAYAKASEALECSVTELQVEIAQHPSKGFLGLFKKPAIIVANCIAQRKSEAAPQVPATEPVECGDRVVIARPPEKLLEIL